MISNNKLLVDASREIIKAFTNFRRLSNEDGLPKNKSSILNFFKSLDKIKKKYNIDIDNKRLIDCYYSYLEHFIDSKRINYDLFINTIIDLEIIKEIN